MPRISVVVPIYNVEQYLEECLESIRGQTFEDLEVVMVEDGSKDGSPAIAERFAAEDERFKLVKQPNGGLGKARNTGIEAATGEYIAFVDSDDFLAPNAYELLLGALEKTGSDFATGNVLRVHGQGLRPSHFLRKAFETTRLGTHVAEHPPLMADRVAWNKLFRRSFWDEQAGRFPEGVLNEDIPVIVPAHFAAKAVDVIADPIYYWRFRDGDQRSITQRRLEPRALRDRLRAVAQVVDWLEKHGKRKWKRWYFEAIIADDLRLYINQLVDADEGYRRLFLDEVNAFLDRAPRGVYDGLLAIERLKWHLVRRRLMPELLEVLRFQRDRLKDTPPVESEGRWYGDYPFRDDERLAIPRSTYLVDEELGLRAEIEALEWDGQGLRVRGNAYVMGIGAPRPDTQELKVLAIRRGALRRLRLKLAAIRLPTRLTSRPDVAATSPQALVDVTWSGFEASLDLAKLRTAGRWVPGTWELFLVARSGRIRRRRGRFHFSPLRPLRGVELPMPDGVAAKAVPVRGGGIAVVVRTRRTTVDGHRLDGEELELSGEDRGSDPATEARLELIRRGDKKKLEYPMEIVAADDGSSARFSTRIRLPELLDTESAAGAGAREEEGERAEPPDPEEVEDRRFWNIGAVSGGARRAVGMAGDKPSTVWRRDGRELALSHTRTADAAVVEQTARPVVLEASWTPEGALRLAGELPQGAGPQEVLLVARHRGHVHAFPAEDASPGRFSAALTPGRVESLAGRLPLREGRWDLYTRPAGAGDQAQRLPLMIDTSLYAQLPLRTTIERKPFALTMSRNDRAVLVVERDLEDGERGLYHQRRLRQDVYMGSRAQLLRDAVVYASFDGRQYSDSPRAIHEELVRREAPFDHLWVVRDGQCEVPDSARAVREGSRAYYEALGSARFVVTNDLFPSWFARREDQVCLQTWHGMPLKRLRADTPAKRVRRGRFAIDWQQQVGNWQHVLSPSGFATPIVQSAYGIEGELLETGYPRHDLLARADRDELGLEVRRRLGVPAGRRTVLYAPTFRDDVHDADGGYLVDPKLDLESLKAAVDDDTVILFRGHPYVLDAIPADPSGALRDVSAYPDATELLLAADVLVTDYSSIMFDYAITGRPMLFHGYDLDAAAKGFDGFHFDLAETVPGPLVRTAEELAAALGDIGRVEAEYASRYAGFSAKFCELADGQASARVVDRLFLR